MATCDASKILSAILISLVLAACSGKSDTAGPAATQPASATGKAEACSLLTADAVAASIGKKVGEGRKTNEAGSNVSHMTTCTWETQPDSAASTPAEVLNRAAVHLILWSWPSEKRSADYIESFRKVAKEVNDPEPTPVALGNEAILAGNELHVRKGTASFTVTVQLFGDTDPKAAGAAAEALARQVLQKL